jgi:type II secretory pathway pseudopilin PulG
MTYVELRAGLCRAEDSGVNKQRGANETAKTRIRFNPGTGTARGVGLLELTASVAIAAIVASAMLGGLGSLSRTSKRTEAVGVVRDAIANARLKAYLGSTTVSVHGEERGLTVVSEQPPGQRVPFELPPGFVVEHFTRLGVIRFFADGLSDNASITIADADSGDRETLLIDTRGEIR